MNRNKAIKIYSITVIVLFLAVSMFSDVNIKTHQQKTETNYFETKTIQTNVVLGWEPGKAGKHTTVSETEAAVLDVTCLATSENVAVLVESAYTNLITEADANIMVNKFQTSVYETIIEAVGLPRKAYDDSRDIAILYAEFDNLFANPPAGFYASGLYSENGYESINIDMQQFPAWNVLAHEFQHLIHRNYRTGPAHETWFNEGMSEAIPAITEVRSNIRSSFLEWYEGKVENYGGPGTNVPLLYWDGNEILEPPFDVAANYAASFAFTYYVYEKYGLGLIGDILRDNQSSVVESFNKYLPEYEIHNTFDELFLDFALACRLDDITLNNGLWGFRDFAFSPTYLQWGDYAPRVSTPDDTDFPITISDRVFHRGIMAYNVNFGNPNTISAFEVEFNGETDGNFVIWGVTREFVNTSYSKNIVVPIPVDLDTQEATGVVILPNSISTFELIVTNINGEHGKYVQTRDGIEETFEAEINPIDPDIEGNIIKTTYDNRTIHITAEVSWGLSDIDITSTIVPNVVLFDKDGEFAFNVQTDLSFDTNTQQWTGELHIPKDIPKGEYQLKLLVQGNIFAEKQITVRDSGSNVSWSISIFPLSISFIVIVIMRKQHSK